MNKRIIGFFTPMEHIWLYLCQQANCSSITIPDHSITQNCFPIGLRKTHTPSWITSITLVWPDHEASASTKTACSWRWKQTALKWARRWLEMFCQCVMPCTRPMVRSLAGQSLHLYLSPDNITVQSWHQGIIQFLLTKHLSVQVNIGHWPFPKPG